MFHERLCVFHGSFPLSAIALVLLPTHYAASGRLVLCLLCSLLLHWLALSSFPAAERQSLYRTPAKLHITMGLSEPVQRVKRPKVPAPRTVRSEPLPAPDVVKEFLSPPDQAARPQPEDELYVDPNDVDQMAFAIEIPELPLPSEAQGSSGLLRIKILIGDHGRADRIEILETTFSEDYVASLVSAFSQGVFQPAILDGKPIKSWRVIDITFGEAEAENQPPAELGK